MKKGLLSQSNLNISFQLKLLVLINIKKTQQIYIIKIIYIVKLFTR